MGVGEFDEEDYVSEETKQFDKTVKTSFGLLALSFVGAYLIYAVYFYFVNEKELVPDSGAWGQFGDFVGGVLNPFVAALALYWLVISLREQRATMSETQSIMSNSARKQSMLASQTRKQNQIIEEQVKAGVILRRLEARQTERIGILNRMITHPKPAADHFMYGDASGKNYTLPEVVQNLDSLIKQDEHELDIILDRIKKLNTVSPMQKVAEQLTDHYGF